jgi:hypothetical protein
MQRRLSILAFAYVFPPDAGSGTYRTLYFSNEWARLGDAVTIVTIKEEAYLPTALVDPGLCAEVHPSIRVERTSASRPLQKLLEIRAALRRRRGATRPADLGTRASPQGNPRPARGFLGTLKDTMTDLLSCPDEHMGWIPAAVRRGYGITKATHVDCIYSTGGPWSGLVAATVLHKLCGIPLVLDFRDPWISNPNLSNKSHLSCSLQTVLEGVCVRSASAVIANTEELREDFARRYPDVNPRKFATVTNGFEQVPRGSADSGGCFTLVHAGELYLSRNPLNLFLAIDGLVRDGTISPDTFRIQLVGGLSVDDEAMNSALRSEGLSSVLEVKPRVPHNEILLIQKRASALLLIQTGFPLQVPRKLYEYLSLARPVLAITEPKSATARMVKELGAGYIAEDSVDSIGAAIAKLHRAWRAGDLRGADENKLSGYSNRYLSGKLREIMLSAI